MSKEGGEGDGKGGERQLQRGGGDSYRERAGGGGGRVREMGQTGSEEEERKE